MIGETSKQAEYGEARRLLGHGASSNDSFFRGDDMKNIWLGPIAVVIGSLSLAACGDSPVVDISGGGSGGAGGAASSGTGAGGAGNANGSGAGNANGSGAGAGSNAGSSGGSGDLCAPDNACNGIDDCTDQCFTDDCCFLQ